MFPERFVENFKRAGKIVLRGGATGVLAVSSLAPHPVLAEEGITFIDNGAYPQCTRVNYMPAEGRVRDPLTMPEPRHPQIQHAIDTLYANGVHNLAGIDIKPQGTKLKFYSAALNYHCLPNEQSTTRYMVQIDEGVGVGLPTGGKDDHLVEMILPEGLNPVVLTTSIQRFPGRQPENQEWLLLNTQPDEETTARNSDGSFTISFRGPLAIQTANSWGRMVEFVEPESGFANDAPIPTPD